VTHHGRPGGVVWERLALLALLVSTVLIFVGSIVFVTWLTTTGPSVGVGLAVFLSAILWRAFFRYYKYDPNTLDPIIEEDDQK
jgi:hypothetical protein